ncbi:MAG: helix-turn-helix transcriptional regulator [Bdellovibrio sp.]
MQTINVRSIKQLGSVIRRHRKLQKISQIDLAKKAGVTQKTISKIESDASKTTITTLLLILTALNLDLTVTERPVKNQNSLEGLF